MERVVTDRGCCEADMVVFGIGLRPNSIPWTGETQDLLEIRGLSGVDLRAGRQACPGVSAVGDCATVYNNAIQAADYIALATNAVPRNHRGP
ncbi:MAG: FAD-dependent oxidoreductase [Enterocloster sp.]